MENPIIETITSSPKEFSFKVKLNGFYADKIEIDKMLYDKIYFADFQTLDSIGLPALPVITELIGIPQNSTFQVSITDTVWVSLNAYMILPFQKPLLEKEVLSKFDINKDFYSNNSKYPLKNYEFTETMIWHGIENTVLTICPFRYFANNRRIDVMKHPCLKQILDTQGNDCISITYKL
jgi:hypothetical protein